jgi:toxin ParE1/3/4
MRVIFSPEARLELNDATTYYENQSQGLGIRFRREVRDALKRMDAWSNAWSVEQGDIRRCLLVHFPYKLLYSIETDHLYVIAVAHLHRRPDYWVDRLPRNH